MKTLALLVFALLPLASCIGAKVDQHTLFPAAHLAWPAVENDLHRGLADAQEDGDLAPSEAGALHEDGERLELALLTRDRAALRTVVWVPLQAFADRGIQDKLADGEIGPGVANSLREQLVNFTAAINRLQEL